jgi:hypothetical protein
MAATQLVRTTITYAEVREENPEQWVDSGLNARTPVPNGTKTVLLVRRIDGVSMR